ncbi:choice-of-anchor D domain-containing protein [Oligoflexaceae bacterium]|nr:choice-of-anchor D domain-containing protein [Oligoflexaceae bacterium]
MKIQLVLAAFLSAFLFQTCGFFLSESSSNERDEAIELKGDQAADGSLDVRITGSTDAPQFISLGEGELSGSEVFFPKNSLDIDISLKMEAGEQLARAENFAKLARGAVGASVAESGKSVLMTSDPSTDLSKPMTVKIEVPKKPSNLLGESYLIIFYKIYKASEDKWFFGVKNEVDFTVEEGKAAIETLHFGVFQPVWIVGENLESEDTVDDEAPQSRVEQDQRNPAAFTTANVDFGSPFVGESAEKTISIKNTGDRFASELSASVNSVHFSFKGGAFPGVGGNCTALLAPGNACTVVVVFKPMQVGLISSKLKLSFNNGKESVFSESSVEGQATSRAVMVFSDSGPVDLGGIIAGTSLDFTLVLNHSGQSEASGFQVSPLTPPFDYKDNAYPGTAGTCGSSLATGSCDLVLTFSPVSTGIHTEVIEFEFFNGIATETVSVEINATALDPALLSSNVSSPYDFGMTANGGSKTVTVTITNDGEVAATSLTETNLAAPFAFSGATYPGAGGNCSTTLAPSTSCDLVLSFAPTVTASISDTMVLSYHDGLAAQSLDLVLDGESITPALVTISGSDPFDYGSLVIGGEAFHTFTLTNSGGVPATGLAGSGLAAPFSFKGGSYPGTGGDCASSLAVSGSCTINIKFQPSISALSSDTIDIDYDNGISVVTVSRDVQGTGELPALLIISDAPPHDFGNVTVGMTSSSMTLTLMNNGEANATIANGLATAPFQFKDSAYPGTGGDCTSTLSSSATCSIVLEFAPTTTGAQSTSITIDYDDGNASTSLAIPIEGTGVM